MTKIPRISGNAMIKYLDKKGFAVTRRKGSHATLSSQHTILTVPAGTSKLKIGLLMGLLRTARIEKEEFVSDHNKGLTK